MWFRQFALLFLATASLLYHNAAASPQWPGASSSWEDVPTSSPSTSPIPATDANDTITDPETRLYTLSRQFFDAMMVPNNLVQLKDLASPLFHENVTGRVSDSRKFPGRELNTEYVFGAFTGPVVNASRVTLLGMPVDHRPLRFAANTRDGSAFMTELVDFNITMLGEVVPVQLDLWLKWNEAGQVTAYDARFVYFDWLMANAVGTLAQKFGLQSADQTQNLMKEQLVQQVCQTAQEHCQGELAVYESAEDCHDFLMGKVPLGQPYQFGQNTVMCRSLHEGMLVLKPEAHCPHVGPTGGDMCNDDLVYGQYVVDPDFEDDYGRMEAST
jgi:hypothetical protein